MKIQNVCKFTNAAFSDTLTVLCYIRESNADVMKKECLLENCRMLLVMQGEGEFRFSGQSVSFRSGDLLFGFAGEKFSMARGEDVVYMYIDFHGTRAEELFRRFGIDVRNRLFQNRDGLIPLWEESLLRAGEDTVDLASESILLYTFSRLVAKSSSKRDIVERVVAYTDENFADPTMSLAGVANMFSYHPKYLSHMFKESRGVNFSEYLRMIRIKYAIALFDHGIDSVKNVALLSGFSDPLYFSGVFKKEIGVSPKEYIGLRRRGEIQ